MQASHDSQSSETIEDIDDNDFAFFQGNRFASILDVSPIYQIFCDLQSLFSKIHCTSSIPNYIGFVHFIILLVQIFVPSYFIGCFDIWKDGTIASEFLRVLHVLNFDIYESIKISSYLNNYSINQSNISIPSLTGAELYSKQLSNDQPIIGLVIALIFIAINIILIFITKTCHASQKINNYMGIMMQIIYTIVFPLLCPLLVASIPFCFSNLMIIKNFKNNVYNYGSNELNYNGYINSNVSEKITIDIFKVDVGLNIKNANIDKVYYIIVIVLVLIAFFYYVLLARTIVFTRVFLEDVPLHSWLPHFPVVLVILVSFISMISIIVFFIEKKNRFYIPLVLTFVYIGFSLYVYMSANLIRVNYSIILSTFLMAGGLMSLVQTINIGVNSISIPSDALFILSMVFLVIVFVVFKIVNNKRLIKYSIFLDEIYENSNNSKELMEKNFKNVFQFLWKIRYMTSLWHPYFLTWELFGFAITKWPNNIWIYIIYSRLLSFFPLKNNQMMWVVIKMKKLHLSVMFNSYLMQLRQLSRTRHSMLSPQIKQQLNVIDIKIENIRSLIRCFWENVLQRNISNVREDAEKVNEKISEMKSIYAQLLENYPNIADVIISCLNFNDEITHDLEESKKVRKKLEILYREGKITNDRSGEIAYSIFPGLRAYLQVYDNQNTMSTINAGKVSKLKSEFFNFGNLNNGNNNNSLFKVNNNNNSNISKNHNNDNRSNTNLGEGNEENEDFYVGETSAQTNNNSNFSELCYATHNITEKSKLGRVWICCIILIFTSCVSIFLFFYYVSIYKNNFISRQKSALNYLQNVYKLHYDMMSLTLVANIYPFTFANSAITIPEPKKFMKIVAPSLYPNHIPMLNLSKENININIADIKNLFGTVIELMSTLDKSDISCEKIDQMMFNDQVLFGMSMIGLSSSMVLNSQKVVQYEDVYSFYNSSELLELSMAIMAANIHFEKIEEESLKYVSMENGNQIKSLDEHMILVLTLTLLLVSFPYVLMLYKLQIQFDSLIDCFTYFPNTEIRSIINLLNKFNNKNIDCDDDKSSRKNKIIKSKISMNPSALTPLNMNIVNDLSEDYGGIRLNNGNQMNGNRDIADSQFSKITQDKTQKLDYFKIIFTFLSSFVVISICSITTLYMAKAFVKKAKNDSVKISTIYRPFIPLKISMLLVIQFYACRLLPDVQLYNMTATETLAATLIMLGKTNTIFAETFWSINSSLGIFFSRTNTFDYFEYVFEELEEKVNQPKTFFEKLATAQFLDSLDMLIVSGYEYVYKYFHSFYAIEKDNEYILSLLYWFSTFDEVNRTNKFIKVIEEEIFNGIEESKDNIDTLTVVTIIWQVLACMFMLLYLVERHNRIRRTLFFFHFLSPSTFIQNKQVLELLETGKNSNNLLKDDSFSNADTILSKYNQGIIITDSKYSIQDFNKAFVEQFDLGDRYDIIGTELFEIVKDELENDNNREHIVAYCEMDLIPEIETNRKNSINNINDNNNNNSDNVIVIKPNHSVSFGKEVAKMFSVNNLITKIFDSLNGKNSPSFSERLFVVLPNGFEHIFIVNVICITAAGVCEVGQHEKIDRIAFIFDECTECMLRQSMLQLELSRITQLLMKVIPTNIVSMITDATNVMNESCVKSSLASSVNDDRNSQKGNRINSSISMANDTNALLQMTTARFGNNISITNNNFNNNINPDDGVSFVSQGVTICQIIVETPNFETINKIFSKFDSQLEKYFSRLTKVRTYMNTYIVIAGLFEEVSKSSQNAEEVIKFSLKVLAKFKNTSGVDFLIGVNSGGPVVAGILSINRPSFQVFGPTMETAKQLARNGVLNAVQISRSVYELVFSFGFHVTERGDIALNDGNMVQTYIVTN